MPRVDDPAGNAARKRLKTVASAVPTGRRQVARRSATGRAAAHDRSPVPAEQQGRQPRRVREARRRAMASPLCAATSSGRLRGSTIRARGSMVHDVLPDPDETVRQAAIHVAGLWRDKAAIATDRALAIVIGAKPPRRGRGPGADRRQVGRAGACSRPPAAADDRILEHSITYALIEIGDPKATAAGLSSDEPRDTKAAMVALDQMDGGGLEPRFVAGLLARRPGLKDTASWIIGRHRDWAERAGRCPRRAAEADRSASRRSGRTGTPARPVRRRRRRSSGCWPRGCATRLPRWPRGEAACRPWPGRI